MHVDLVESLRCPNGHADGWLVAAADRVVNRRMLEGTIGCPHCGVEWPVRDGELHFHASAPARGSGNAGDASDDPATAGTPHAAGTSATPGGSDARTGADAPDIALRLAALLDLTDARGVVLLAGTAARAADALAELTGVPLLAVNAPPGVALAHSRVRVQHAFPLGVGTMRGVQLDQIHSAPSWLHSALRAVQRGGRVIAPASLAVPADVSELARDDSEWVGEVRVAASGLVPLRRAGDPMA